MTTFAEIQALAALAASTGDNMTEAQKGGGGGRTLPDGYAFGRLVEYIEFGAQPQEYLGVAKDPALEVQLGFALTGVGYANDDGTPYILRPFSMAMSRNEKAKAFLLFKALNWKGTATHFAQLLGEGFLVKIYQHQSKKPGSKPSSSIDLKGFLPPLDPVTKMAYPIAPPRDEDFKVFLWDHPSITGWNSLFIKGERDDGTSMNFVQNKLLGACDFSGSALEQLLLSSGTAFTKPVAKAAAVAPAGPAVPTAVAPAAPALPNVPAVPALPAVAAIAPVLAAVPAAVVPAAPVTAPAIPALPAAVAPVMVAVPQPLPWVADTAVSSLTAPALPSLPGMPALPSLPALPALPLAA